VQVGFTVPRGKPHCGPRLNHIKRAVAPASRIASKTKRIECDPSRFWSPPVIVPAVASACASSSLPLRSPHRRPNESAVCCGSSCPSPSDWPLSTPCRPGQSEVQPLGAGWRWVRVCNRGGKLLPRRQLGVINAHPAQARLPRDAPRQNAEPAHVLKGARSSITHFNRAALLIIAPRIR